MRYLFLSPAPRKKRGEKEMDVMNSEVNRTGSNLNLNKSDFISVVSKLLADEN